MNRRLFLVFACAMLGVLDAGAQAPTRITVSVPGPHNISYLPIDLIPRIGADVAEGVQLRIQYTGGGGVALKNLDNRNADFAVAGLPAQMSMRSNGGDVTTIAAVNDLPLFVLMVRADLRDKVRRLADLKGRVLGVNTSTQNAKTTSQQLLELLLQSDGVKPGEVTIVSAGQSWEEQSSVLKARTVDAVMGDEPFAGRLRESGQVFFLVNLGDKASAQAIPGSRFLHAAVATRSDVIARSPAIVEKMVRMVRRSLEWIGSHPPEELVARLDIADAQERTALLKALKTYPHSYSTNGRLSTSQLAETDTFFHAAVPSQAGFRVETMVNDRWAGRRE